ncbi:MAG: hypothetical protein IID51_07825 [Proteobacteria bacterium]|nr:hypothetical protein [Pseudomonadota bacterium]
MNTSEKILGISRERWWFIARLYAAWTVISYFRYIAFSTFSPLTIRSTVWTEQEWGMWGSYFLSGFGYGWVYFIGGFLVIRYFRETWLQTTLGIAAVGTAFSGIYMFFPFLDELVASGSSGFADATDYRFGLAWYGAAIISNIIPLLFVVAGGALRILLTRAQPAFREILFTAQIFVLYLAASGLAASLIQVIDYNLVHFTHQSLTTLIFPRDYLAETWSYVLLNSALEAIFFVPLLYTAASLFAESWRKVALTMLAVGASAALLPELLATVVHPWYLEASDSVFESNFQTLGSGLVQDKSTAMIEYFRKTALPDLVQYILVLSAGSAAIALRHFVPPGQLRSLIRRIRRWV